MRLAASAQRLRAFVAASADVVLVARAQSRLDEVVRDLRRESNRQVSALSADVTNVSELQSLVARTVASHGRPHILVNNAGGPMPASLKDTTPAQLDDAFHFNVTAPFTLTKAAIPHLAASPNGSVINISSEMARVAAPNHVGYATVKAALSHLTCSLPIELAPDIRVNAIAPA